MAFFDLHMEEKVFMSQVYSTVFRELKGVLAAMEGIGPIMALKEYFSILHRILKILSMGGDPSQYESYLG